jgi:hypothetical protein
MPRGVVRRGLIRGRWLFDPGFVLRLLGKEGG